MSSILVVDDRSAAREMLRMALECAGHQVVLAEPPHALEVLQQRAVDIVLADLGMPRTAGFDLVAATQRDHPAVRVVLMTGSHYAGHLELAEIEGRDGVAAVLRKPVSLPDLYATIDRCRPA